MANGYGVRVSLENLGCRVNRVELDQMALALEEAGATICGAGEADIVVLNTCAVTAEAEAKTRKAIRRSLRLKRKPYVIACGCAAMLAQDEIEGLSDRVEVVPLKAQVPARIMEIARDLDLSPQEPATSSTASTVTPTGRTRPGIKIQDGCDLRCTYCIVWKARGPSRSMPAREVLEEVEKAKARGAHEVVLTGINLGCYDDGTARLPQLIQKILDEIPIERIRLSSIEPQDVTGELLDVMAGSGGRVAPFLHICLQSGSDTVLRRMGRAYDTEKFAQVCAEARDKVAGIALGTDLICAFPGETDEEFGESLAFCERMHFAKMHVFRYSKRPGTPAAARTDQVPAQVSAERARKVRDLAMRMRLEEMCSHEGEEALVLVQEPGKAIDGHLFDVEVDERLAPDTLVRVRLVMDNDRLVGVED